MRTATQANTGRTTGATGPSDVGDSQYRSRDECIRKVNEELTEACRSLQSALSTGLTALEAALQEEDTRLDTEEIFWGTPSSGKDVLGSLSFNLGPVNTRGSKMPPQVQKDLASFQSHIQILKYLKSHPESEGISHINELRVALRKETDEAIASVKSKSEIIETLLKQCPVEMRVGICVNPDPSVVGDAHAKLAFVVDKHSDNAVYECPLGAWYKWTTECEKHFPGSTASCHLDYLRDPNVSAVHLDKRHPFDPEFHPRDYTLVQIKHDSGWREFCDLEELFPQPDDGGRKTGQTDILDRVGTDRDSDSDHRESNASDVGT